MSLTTYIANSPHPINDGDKVFSSTEQCSVVSESPLEAKVWFKTSALNKETIAGIQQIQLFTNSRDQGWASDPEASFSWFELAILSSGSTNVKIRADNGKQLVWRSHNNLVAAEIYLCYEGEFFSRNHELFSFLEEGDTIAVRVCAQYLKWANHAKEGKLVLHMSHGEARPSAPTTVIQPQINQQPTKGESSVPESSSTTVPKFDALQPFPPRPSAPIPTDQPKMTQQPPLRGPSVSSSSSSSLDAASPPKPPKFMQRARNFVRRILRV